MATIKVTDASFKTDVIDSDAPVLVALMQECHPRNLHNAYH